MLNRKPLYLQEWSFCFRLLEIMIHSRSVFPFQSTWFACAITLIKKKVELDIYGWGHLFPQLKATDDSEKKNTSSQFQNPFFLSILFHFILRPSFFLLALKRTVWPLLTFPRRWKDLPLFLNFNERLLPFTSSNRLKEVRLAVKYLNVNASFASPLDMSSRAKKWEERERWGWGAGVGKSLLHHAETISHHY